MGDLIPLRNGVLHDLALRVDVIDSWDGFRALRTEWLALERRDPHVSVFLSWAWLAVAFHANPGRWRVVVVCRGSRLICVLPLKYRVHWSRSTGAFQSEIEAGGRLAGSEYTGFLCDPAYQTRALALVAQQMQALPWSRLSLRYEDSPDRAQAFLTAFPPDAFDGGLRPYRINAGQTDNLICPRVNLPDTFEDYLDGISSRSHRQKLRRAMRQIGPDGELSLSLSTTESFPRDMAALMRLWMAKWAPLKGEETARRVADTYRTMLQTAQRLGLLHMPVLRRGDHVLGALGHVVDPHQKRLCFIVGGRDDGGTDQTVGAALHGAAIRWAIGAGHSTYDFCHGDEPYKFAYGATGQRVQYLAIRRRGRSDGMARFDPISAPAALDRVLGFIRDADQERAARGCRQVLQAMSPQG